MELDLHQYIDILKRYFLTILLVMMVTVTVVLLVFLQLPPVYQAQATVRVLQDFGNQEFGGIGIDYGERLMNTYQYVITSWPNIIEAAKRLGKENIDIAELADNVQAEIIPNSELITIRVTDQDPVFARDLANMLAVMLVEYNENIYRSTGHAPSTLDILQEQISELEAVMKADRDQLAKLLAERTNEAEIEIVRNRLEINSNTYTRLLTLYEQAQLAQSVRARSVTVVEYATVPTTPENIFSLRHLAISLIAGLFAGIALALVMENIDTRVRSPQQVERLTRLSVIGSVPRGPLPQHLDDSYLTAPPSGIWSWFRRQQKDYNRTRLEAYKILNVNLQRLKEIHQFNTLLITSARSREGKTSVALNLAAMSAQTGKTVFLLEGDLHRPSITKHLNLNPDIGLSSYLTGQMSMGDIIQPTENPNLYVITGGPPLDNTAKLLNTPTADKLLQYLGNQAQITIIDAPPVLDMADASILASRVDGVILVIGQEIVRRDQLSSALRQLETVNAKILGVVFVNKTRSD